MSFFDSPRARSFLPLAVAMVAHGAMIFGASRLPSARSLLRSNEPIDAASAIDVDLENAAPVLPPVPVPPEKPEEAKPATDEAKPVTPAAALNAAPRIAAEHAAPIARPAPGAQSGADPAPTEPGAPPAPAKGSEGPNPPDEYGGAAPPPIFDPSANAGLAFALQPSAAAPTEAPRASHREGDAATHAIESTLRSHDKRTGVNVPAAGVVATVVSTTVRGLALPHNTHATVEVTLGPQGKVTGARVTGASAGDAAQWDGAMKAIASSLSSQALKLGPDVDKTGVIVRVSLTTKHVFPSGTAKGADVKPVCANGIINELATAADDKPSKPVDPTVPMFQDENGRPCIPVGVNVSGDASNIGAEKHIEVQSSFEVIVPGQMNLPEEIDPVNTDAPWVERGKPGPRPTLPQKARQYIRERERKK